MHSDEQAAFTNMFVQGKRKPCKQEQQQVQAGQPVSQSVVHPQWSTQLSSIESKSSNVKKKEPMNVVDTHASRSSGSTGDTWPICPPPTPLCEREKERKHKKHVLNATERERE